jgi:hypothetical protein
MNFESLYIYSNWVHLLKSKYNKENINSKRPFDKLIRNELMEFFDTI